MRIFTGTQTTVQEPTGLGEGETFKDDDACAHQGVYRIAGRRPAAAQASSRTPPMTAPPCRRIRTREICRVRRGGLLVGSAYLFQRFESLPDDDRQHGERGEGVGPRPAERQVQTDAGQQCNER